MNTYSDVKKFYESFCGEKKIIGRTDADRAIYAMKVGCGYPVAIVQGGIHAREWITAYLVMEQIRYSLTCGSAWFIPLMNPDGAALCQCGLSAVSGEWQRKLLYSANGADKEDFTRWKANGNAVDLNVNFDAEWGTGTYNVRFPCSQNYIGTAPFSEKETKALRDFTLQVCPQLTVSYHTQGEEIFWKFRQPCIRCLRDKRLACALSEQTGYPLRYAAGSVGGYKDWCIKRLKIPAFTVEVGRGTHPIGKDQMKNILSANVCSIDFLLRKYCQG